MYQKFAEIYDEVMRDVDYPLWAEYVLHVGGEIRQPINKVLNLACGTGNLEMIIASQIPHWEGVDASGAMLAEARRKLSALGIKIPLHEANMVHYRSGQQFDMVLCLYDSLNYLLQEEEVRGTFATAYTHLEPGGVFIFDVTTEYNILHNFAEYTFAENMEKFSYIWENQYNLLTKIIHSHLTIFELVKGDHFHRYEEDHSQRIYTRVWLEAAVRAAGFQLRAVYDGFSKSKPGRKCERLHFVAQRPQTKSK